MYTFDGEASEAISREDKKVANYDVFLSYATAEREEASQIRQAITEAGRKVFMARKDVNPGDDFAETIREALRSSKELWLLVSPTSIKSEWVISEWGAAWVLRKNTVPILYRCDTKDLPDRLRRLQCIDFNEYPNLIRNRFQREDAGSAS